MACETLIDNAILVDCNRTKGFKRLGVIVNYDDIDWSATKKATGDNFVYNSFALLSGKTGYKVEQEVRGAFDGTTTELEVGDYSSSFKNGVAIKIFGGDKTRAKIATELSRGEFVLILEQKDKGANGDSAFRIYGMDNGLMASAISNEPNSDNGNIWDVTLEETGSPVAATFLFSTDYSTTKAIVDSLVTE